MTSDPLLAALLDERYSSTWWFTGRPEDVDSALMQGLRRRALSEALDSINEAQEGVA